MAPGSRAMPIAIPGVIVRRESLQAGDGRSNSGISVLTLHCHCPLTSGQSAREDWSFSRLEKNHPDCLPVIIAAHALVLDDGESGASASRSTDTSIQTEAARPTGVLP